MVRKLLNAEICEKSAVLCAAAVGLVAAGAGVGLGIAAAGAVLSLPAIWKSFKERGNADFDKVIQKVAKGVELDFSRAVAVEGFKPEAQNLASAAMGRVLSEITLDREMLMQAGRDNAKYATVLVARAATQNAADYSLEANSLDKAQIEVNRRFLHVALKLTFDTLDGEPLFEEKMVPLFHKEVFARLDGLHERHDQSDKMAAKTHEKLDNLASIFEGMDLVKFASEARVSKKFIFDQARRIDKDTDDLKTASADLERAVTFFKEGQEKGFHGSNLGHVDKLLNHSRVDTM